MCIYQQFVHKQKKKLRLLLINLIWLINGCDKIQSEIWYTHMINPKHLPIELIDKSGNKHQINEGNYAELLDGSEGMWTIKTLINGNIIIGQIPQKNKTGNPVLVYLEQFDKKIKRRKSLCNEIQLKPYKVLTLRTRPLKDDELSEMIANRTSEKSIGVNKETAIFGIEHGVKFELLDENFGTWQKIKIHTKNKAFVGYINKVVKGIPTRKNNCK